MKIVTNKQKRNAKWSRLNPCGYRHRLGLLFKEQIGNFVSNTFESLNSATSRALKIWMSGTEEHSNRGSCNILPLVIAGLQQSSAIIVNMYLSLSLQSRCIFLFEINAGSKPNNLRLDSEIREYEWEKEMYWIRPVIAMEEEREYRIPSLFRNRLTDTQRAFISLTIRK
jgi:hypothetical protein